MANFQIDGLMSGLQTTSMIDAIMAVERLPQLALQDKVKNYEKQIQAMQDLNSKLATLKNNSKDIANGTFWGTSAATSSNESVTVSSGTTAPATELNFDVTAVAATHAEVLDWSFDPGVAQGTIDEASYSEPPPVLNLNGSANVDPNAVAQFINSSSSNYTASVIDIGGGSYKLMVTSREPGAAGAFQMSVTVDGNASKTSSTMTEGADAEITFGAGTANEFKVTSSSNTFTGLSTGVDVTVSELATGVKVGVAKDNDVVAETVKGMVDGLNELLGDIKTKSYSNPAGDGLGNGPLTGSGLLRGMSMQLSSASSGFADGGAVYEAGIQIQRDGKFEFDEARFKELLASDPDKAKQIITDVANRVSEVAESYSAPSSGVLSSAIKSKQGQVEGLNDQIEKWDIRLELRENTMRKQFTAMESMLSSISSQGSWLASQLPSMAAPK